MEQKQLEKLTDYEYSQAMRLLKMRDALIAKGLTNEAAIRRINSDLKRWGSFVKPSFVRLVLKQPFFILSFYNFTLIIYFVIMAVVCKGKCLYLKNTSRATSGYDLDKDSNGVCKTCRTCGYFIITDVLRCVCCGHKFALKNRKRQNFRPSVLEKKENGESNNDDDYDDYTKKINGLIDLSYT